MTSYLLSSQSGPMPFTGAEICDELGIDADRFAFTIDGLIAVEVINCAAPTRHTVWRISCGDRFEKESLHGNCHPDAVSEPFEYQGRQFVDCTYEPRDWAVEMIRKRVLTKARHNEDIHLFLAVSEADRRKADEAKAELRDALTRSIAAADAPQVAA